MVARGEITASNELTHKYWEPTLSRDIIEKNPFSPYMGTASNSVIQIKTALQKNAGDKITFGLANPLQGRGVTGAEDLEGKTEPLTTRYDSVWVDALAHGAEYPGRMTDQRVDFDTMSEVKNGLGDWGAVREAQAIGLHLAGITGQFYDNHSGETKWAHEGPAAAPSPSPYVLGNLVRAPAAGRIIRAGSRANDESLTSSDVFDLPLVLKAKKILDRAARPAVRKLSDGVNSYICFIDVEQQYQLQSAASGLWKEIQLGALQARDSKDNPLYTGAVGIYSGIIFVPTIYMPRGIHSSTGALVATSRRAVLVGAQAAVFAYGKNSGRSSTWSWFEEKFDVGRKWRCSIEAILGCVKTQYKLDTDAADKTDFGTCVISTYAEA